MLFKTSKNEVKLKKVLLIDDIYTTGVTMDEAAKALLCDGVKEVRFLVLCTGKRIEGQTFHQRNFMLYWKKKGLLC